MEVTTKAKKISLPPPFEVKQGRVFDFGVLRITEGEQGKLIEESLEKHAGSFENETHHKNHCERECQQFEGKVVHYGVQVPGKDYCVSSEPHALREPISKNASIKTTGYCKSNACRAKGVQQAVWSVFAGKVGTRLCKKCFARVLCNLRKTEPGIHVQLYFSALLEPSDQERRGSWADEEGSLLVDFKEEKIVLWFKHRSSGGLGTKLGNFSYTQRVNEQGTLQFFIDGRVRYGEVVFTGLRTGQMLGRRVCENIMTGRECQSVKIAKLENSKELLSAEDLKDLERVRKNVANFASDAVPPGTPGFKEISPDSDSKDAGLIYLLRFCRACAIFDKQEEESAMGLYSSDSPDYNETREESPSVERSSRTEEESPRVDRFGRTEEESPRVDRFGRTREESPRMGRSGRARKGSPRVTRSGRIKKGPSRVDHSGEWTPQVVRVQELENELNRAFRRIEDLNKENSKLRGEAVALRKELEVKRARLEQISDKREQAEMSNAQLQKENELLYSTLKGIGNDVKAICASANKKSRSVNLRGY